MNQPNIKLTLQNTVPEHSLRRIITPIDEFYNTSQIIELVKEEFLIQYAADLQSEFKSLAKKLKSEGIACGKIAFSNILHELDKFFIKRGFYSVVNFPIRINTKVYAINFSLIQRGCNHTSHISFTEIETVCIPIPNEQCCDNTCNYAEIAYDLWDKLQTTIKTNKLTERVVYENALFKHFEDFYRFPIETVNMLLMFNNGIPCIDYLQDVYTEDEIYERIQNIRTNISTNPHLFLVGSFFIESLNKRFNLFSEKYNVVEFNRCTCEDMLAVKHHNEINSILNFECEEISENNYIIYFNLGISESYKLD